MTEAGTHHEREQEHHNDKQHADEHHVEEHAGHGHGHGSDKRWRLLDGLFFGVESIIVLLYVTCTDYGGAMGTTFSVDQDEALDV